ncbi:uncharacterized protein LOC119733191 [Patiria miniata]|uniref:Uncharacterized protein n=1 Tax=Patiria miniata TaxID=46514 RepID=A0A914AGQ8_PATMI|nr:uncharacterized protein LOC119733191 [Patiria miniata]
MTCYRDYTRYLTRSSEPGTENKYDVAFTQFCSYVNQKIIVNKEILRLNKLNQQFIQQVKDTDGIDITSYKTTSLKRRLQLTFPQLCFHRPKDRRQSEIVFVDDIPVDTLVEDRQLLKEALHSPSTTDTDTTDLDSEATTSRKKTPSSFLPSVDQLTLSDLFMSAQALKKEINDVDAKLPWPPTALHLTIDAAQSFVPALLFNFLAWAVGAHSDPSEDGQYVKVEDAVQNRILTIAQDIVYLASKGRVQTPKHLSLAMTLRHLSGSSQLIGLMNGLGYCVSHSVALEHDTALAK